MLIVRNTGHIKEQQRQGRLLTVLGLVGMAAAFALVLFQRNATLNATLMTLVAYALMLLSFVFFNMGLQRITKFSSNERKKRPDELVDQALSRLNDRVTAIHYAELGKRVVDHLLVYTGGVVVLTLRDVTGKVQVNEHRWRKVGNPLGRIFNYSAPQLGNPSYESEQDIAAVQAVLTEQGLPDKVTGAVVFTSPLAEVEGSSPLDVLGIDGLYDYMRDLTTEASGRQLANKDRQAIIAALSQGKELEQPSQRPERRKRPT